MTDEESRRILRHRIGGHRCRSVYQCRPPFGASHFDPPLADEAARSAQQAFRKAFLFPGYPASGGTVPDLKRKELEEVRVSIGYFAFRFKGEPQESEEILTSLQNRQ